MKAQSGFLAALFLFVAPIPTRAAMECYESTVELGVCASSPLSTFGVPSPPFFAAPPTEFVLTPNTCPGTCTIACPADLCIITRSIK